MARVPVPLRFIPTRVGNTHLLSSALHVFSVHPHTGGEHTNIKSTARSRYGSSPHGWGTHQPCGQDGHTRRFIPTRVGNTSSSRTASIKPAVHPHTGGEHTSLVLNSQCISGSSPHGWGTPARLPGFRLGPRFIPTRVGNTCARAPVSTPAPVHPHTGGEHVVHDNPHVVEERFIPTRVGNTRLHRLRCPQSPVHPHTGGEHSLPND